MLKVESRAPAGAPADETLVLTFELRQKSRLRTRLASGEDVGLFLDHGTVLRDGDHLQGHDGRVVRVVAADEALMEARIADPLALARAAYHLGNRHVHLQIGTGWLRFQSDGVLGRMLGQMGITPVEVTAPFDPEPGAYGGGHHHHSAEAKHSGIIHEYGRR